MCLLGRRGLKELAEQNLARAEYAKQAITSLPGFSLRYSGPTFNEFAVRVRGADTCNVVEKLASRAIFGGVAAGGKDEVLLVAVTERHSKADIDKLVLALDEVTR